jgi:hypothetical protein
MGVEFKEVGKSPYEYYRQHKDVLIENLALCLVKNMINKGVISVGEEIIHDCFYEGSDPNPKANDQIIVTLKLNL